LDDAVAFDLESAPAEAHGPVGAVALAGGEGAVHDLVVVPGQAPHEVARDVVGAPDVAPGVVDAHPLAVEVELDPGADDPVVPHLEDGVARGHPVPGGGL